MTTVMNMSSYVVEETSTVNMGDESEMRADWNQRRLELAIQQHTVNPMDRSLPASLVLVDMEVFLQKMRAYRC